MPVVQITPPTLTEVQGFASKSVSTGYLNIEIRVTAGAGDWPPTDELNYYLLELFTVVASKGWVGSVSKQYVSAESIVPDPAPEPEPEPPSDEPLPARAPEDPAE